MAVFQDSDKAMEQLRRRLQQLSSSLGALTKDLQMNDPLPTWPSLQKRADLLSKDLSQLQEILSQNASYLSAAHAYPHASFPGATQEFLIQQLLRKKAEPWVEDWVEDNTNPAKVRKSDPYRDAGLGEEEQRELWAFAGPTESGIIRELLLGGAMQYEYTLKEREEGVGGVVTGLRRVLGKRMKGVDDDEESEEEDEEGEGEGETMEDVVPAAKPVDDPIGELRGLDTGKYALPIEAVMRYMSAGVAPAR